MHAAWMRHGILYSTYTMVWPKVSWSMKIKVDFHVVAVVAYSVAVYVRVRYCYCYNRYVPNFQSNYCQKWYMYNHIVWHCLMFFVILVLYCLCVLCKLVTLSFATVHKFWLFRLFQTARYYCSHSVPTTVQYSQIFS